MKRNFTKNLIDWKNNPDRKPLIVKGVRQCGKTYIITEFGKKYFSQMHYVNFEDDQKVAEIFEKDLKPDRIISDLEFLLETRINLDKDLVFFDEIQYCPRALTSLKYFQEKMPKLALCSAGSLLGIHLNSGSFPVGKVDILNLYPMSFMEFLEAIDDHRSIQFLSTLHERSQIPHIIHNHLWEKMKHYLVVGGFPEAVQVFRHHQNDLFKAMQLVRDKQKMLLLGFDSDIAKHAGKINAMHIERIFKAIPIQLAKEQDGSLNRFKFKGVVPGISRYSGLIGAIDWLLKAGLILKVPIINEAQLPFLAFSKENIFKLYLADVGILGALSKLPPKTILDYDYGSYKGYFAENFSLQEFYASGDDNIYSWHKAKSEVEFLRENQGNIIPIEVKSGWVTQAKSLKVFAEKYHPKYRVILSGRNFHIDHENQVHHYPLYLASQLFY